MKSDEPMRRRPGNGHPSQANSGKIKRLLKDARGGKRRHHKRRRNR